MESRTTYRMISCSFLELFDFKIIDSHLDLMLTIFINKLTLGVTVVTINSRTIEKSSYTYEELAEKNKAYVWHHLHK